MATHMQDVSDSDSDDDISTTYTEEDVWVEDQEFEVETVLAETTTEDGEKLYLIQWKGYDILESTWEPPDNIQDESILVEWKDRRMREMRKMVEPFDLATFERRLQEKEHEKVERHRKKRIKRKQLGMPVSPSPTVSEAEDSESSVEAMEVDERPEDDHGMKRLSKRPMQRASIFQTKTKTKDDAMDHDDSDGPVAEKLQRQKKKKIESHDARPTSQSSSDVPLFEKTASALSRKRQQLQRSSSDFETSKQRLNQPSLASNAALSATGYQGTARAKVIGPRSQFLASRAADQGSKPTVSSTAGTRGLTSLRGATSRGRGATRGRPSAFSRNVFAPQGIQKRKKKILTEKLVESTADPTKPQGIFRNMSTRRRAELAGRAVQDAAPDISALPGGLFDPSKGFQALRPTDIRKDAPFRATSREDESNQEPLTLYGARRDIPPARPAQGPQSTVTTSSGTHNMICWYWKNRGSCNRHNDSQRPCRYLHHDTRDAPVAPGPLPKEQKSQTVCRWGLSCSEGDRCEWAHPERKTNNADVAPHIQGTSQANRKVCQAFLAMGCMAGRNCQDLHPDQSNTYKGQTTCSHWSRGNCIFPEGGCPWRHGQASEAKQESHRPEETGVRNIETTRSGVTARPKSVSFAFDESMQFYDEPETFHFNQSKAPAVPSQHAIESSEPTARPPLQSHYSTTSLLDQRQAQVPTERRTSLPTFLPVQPQVPRRTTKFKDYQMNKEFSEMAGVTKKVTFGSNRGEPELEPEPIEIKFLSLEILASYPRIYQSFNATEKLIFSGTCIAEDFEFQQKSMLHLVYCQGSVGTDSFGHATIDPIIEHLNASSSGLICSLQDCIILLYPAKCEKWRFLDVASSSSAEGRLKYLFSKLDMPVKLSRDKLHGPSLGASARLYKSLFGNVIHHLSLSTILPEPSKFSQPHIFLMFPTVAMLSAEFISSFIQAKRRDAIFYSSQSEGSWVCFVKAKASRKIVLFHRSAVTLVSKCPSILKLLSNEHCSTLFWFIDDSFALQPEFTFLPPIMEARLGRVRPVEILPLHKSHGGAILLTPSFLVAEPEKTQDFLIWFKTAVGKAPFGTWKLVCCHSIREYLLDLAVDKASDLKQFKEDHQHDDTMDARASKRGLSYEKCKQRFEVHNEIVNLLSRGTFFERSGSGKLPPGRMQVPLPDFDHHSASDGKEPLTETLTAWRGIQDVDEPDEMSNHIIYAHHDIDPDDEQGLATWFAAWSLRRIDVFRRFFIVGTGKEHANRAFRMKQVTPEKLVHEHNDISSITKKALGDKPVSFSLIPPKPKIFSSTASNVRNLSMDGTHEYIPSNEFSVKDMRERALSIAGKLTAQGDQRNQASQAFLSAKNAANEKQSVHIDSQSRPLPTHGMSPIPAGTVLVADQAASPRGIRIEIRPGDRVKVSKHVSGSMYYGRNLNSDQVGQFASNLFARYLKQEPVSSSFSHHPARDSPPISAGMVLVAEIDAPDKSRSIDIRAGELVKIEEHVMGMTYYGKNLNTDQYGHFSDKIFADYLHSRKRRIARTESKPTKIFNHNEVSRQLCAFFNEGRCRFIDGCVRKHLCCKCGMKHGANVCDGRAEERKPLRTHTESKKGIPMDVLVKQVCGWFNQSSCDFGARCLRRHICAVCHATTHGAKMCPGLVDGGSEMNVDARIDFQTLGTRTPTPIQHIKPEDQYPLQFDGADEKSQPREVQRITSAKDDKPSSVSASGIETSVNGQRPGYVPPEDTNVYRAPRNRSVLPDYQAKSPAGSTKKSNSIQTSARSPSLSVSMSPVERAGYVAPSSTSESMCNDEPSDGDGHIQENSRRRPTAEAVEPAKRKIFVPMEVTTEWYGRQKAEGKAWEHINVDQWEESFKAIDPQLAAHAPKRS